VVVQHRLKRLAPDAPEAVNTDSRGQGLLLSTFQLSAISYQLNRISTVAIANDVAATQKLTADSYCIDSAAYSPVSSRCGKQVSGGIAASGGGSARGILIRYNSTTASAKSVGSW
jgi:hypothetical protein